MDSAVPQLGLWRPERGLLSHPLSSAKCGSDDGEESVSSSLSYSSFQDLRDQWEVKSNASGSCCSSSTRSGSQRSRNSSRPGTPPKQGSPRRKPFHKLRPSDTSKSVASCCSSSLAPRGNPPVRSYPNHLYKNRRDSPSFGTTASSTTSSDLKKRGGKKKQFGASRGRLHQKGDLAREFDRSVDMARIDRALKKNGFSKDRDFITARSKVRNDGDECSDPASKDHASLEGVKPRRCCAQRRDDEWRRNGDKVHQQQQLEMGEDADADDDKGEGEDSKSTSRLQSDLMISSPTTVHSLSLNAGPCELCLSLGLRDASDHPTLRCRMLTDEDVGVEGRARTEELKRSLVTEQLTGRTAIESIHLNHAGRQHLIPLQDQPQAAKAATPPLEDNSPKKKSLPELGAFLSSPTGLNWEDLVRSIKQKGCSEPLLNKIIAVTSDDVSELGSREGLRFAGDEHGFGSIPPGDWFRRRFGVDDDELSASSSISSKSLRWSCKENNGIDAGTNVIGKADSLEKLVEQVLMGRIDGADPLLGTTVGGPGGKDDEGKSPHVKPSCAKILSRQDSLEKKIERVVSGQQIGGQRKVAANKKVICSSKETSEGEEGVVAKRIPRITPPRQDCKAQPLARLCFVKSSPKPRLGRSGSAFSRVEASPMCPRSTPTTKIPYDPSTSNCSLRVRRTGETTFVPIERHPMATPWLSPIVTPTPISLGAQGRRGVSGTSSPRNIDFTPRLSTEARGHIRKGSPSDPPIVMSISTDELTAGSPPVQERPRRSPDDPPLLSITRSMEWDMESDDRDEESFYQPRCMNPFVNGDALEHFNEEDIGDKGDKGGEAAFVPFPTSILDNGANSGPCSKAASITRLDFEAELTNDNHERKLCLAASGSSPGKRRIRTGCMSIASMVAGSLKSSKGQSENCTVRIEGVGTSVSASEGISILPQSLSVNRGNPTYWQVARHRIRRTRGEF